MNRAKFERLAEGEQKKIVRQVRYNFSYEAMPKDDTGFFVAEKIQQVELFKQLWPRRHDKKVRYFLNKYTLPNLRYIKTAIK